MRALAGPGNSETPDIAVDVSHDLALLGVLQAGLAVQGIRAELREHLMSLVIFRPYPRLPVCVFVSEGRFYCWNSGLLREHVEHVNRAAAKLAETVSDKGGTSMTTLSTPQASETDTACPMPGTPETATFCRSYPGRSDYVQRVRADLAPFVRGCPRADDLIMVASELAANAALHSRSGEPGGQFTVRAELYHGDYAWVEVEDRGGSWTAPDHGDDRPHGLDIVTLLAGPGNWGTDDTVPGNRVVWVRLDWTEEP